MPLQSSLAVLTRNSSREYNRSCLSGFGKVGE